jgi:hypothetical protein
MKCIAKTWFFGLLAVATLLAQDAKALPVGDDPLYDSLLDAVCSIGRGPAEAGCKVYKYTSGTYTEKYVYTHPISNIDSDARLSFFSVATWDGFNVLDAGYEPPIDVVAPEISTVVESPPRSVDALFTNPILSYGATKTSTVLGFVSDYAPTLGNGKLFGTTSGIPHSATEDLRTPTAEPATVVLLGTCGLVTAARQI